MKKRQMIGARRNVIKSMVAMMCMMMGWSLQGQAQSEEHFLVAGSMATLESAQDLISTLRLRNPSLTPGILNPMGNSPKYRVYVYTSVDKQAVQNFKGQLTMGGKDDWWILSVPYGSRGAAPAGGATRRMANPTMGTTSFHYVVGSFDTKERAESEIEELRSQGLKEAYIILPNGGSAQYRVSLFWSSSRRETESYASLAKKRANLTKGWILTADYGIQTTLGSASNARFHLIAGSLRTQAQANEAATKWRAKGYQVVVLPPVTGKYNNWRVSIFQAQTKADAQSEQTRIGASAKSFWIYEQQ
ncbi:SPOR domain-containing protein [Pontibacter sp. G13]|uniref:SPOR domain-containing protein n=1 Tax=Pontibacter sp. G13 TaxID=3074898 RepID=UPI00288C20B3|nr:SPOR domain-containing protein [Pontibacter sp. G13]WNJ18062.1 SPOR domain-containing protein [Pontibacter sp. G13]